MTLAKAKAKTIETFIVQASLMIVSSKYVYSTGHCAAPYRLLLELCKSCCSTVSDLVIYIFKLGPIIITYFIVCSTFLVFFFSPDTPDPLT